MMRFLTNHFLLRLKRRAKKSVCEANLDLVNKGVVIYTWGNVSGISDDRKYMVIRPSGVDYDGMSPEDMVVVDIATGESVEGKWKPSSDTKTHLELYRKYQEIKGIVHTHSVNAVAFAQAGMAIPALGTTHADYFYGDIPCTRELTKQEVMEDYETNTGKVIIETVDSGRYDPMAIPGIVVKNHGPFAWGKSPANAVYNAVVMEKVAEMDLKTLQLNPNSVMAQYVLDKHYMRKHGPNAYYGQK
jgi:L-ribulose-5-phosphate 4-epimerase